ncbi:MAG: hypothetical protein ACFCVD_16225 [Nodosilinea sp.]
MKILTKNDQVLVLQRGTKVEFLVSTAFVMLGCLVIAGGLLQGITTSFGLGWRVLLFLPLLGWLFWLTLRRFLSNKKIVTVYKLNKKLNQATIEFKGLRQSEIFELPLHEIKSIEVKFLDSHYIGYGYTHVRFQLYLLTNVGRVFALDQAIGMFERRELEAIACHFRRFLFGH